MCARPDRGSIDKVLDGAADADLSRQGQLGFRNKIGRVGYGGPGAGLDPTDVSAVFGAGL